MEIWIIVTVLVVITVLLVLGDGEEIALLTGGAAIFFAWLAISPETLFATMAIIAIAVAVIYFIKQNAENKNKAADIAKNIGTISSDDDRKVSRNSLVYSNSPVTKSDLFRLDKEIAMRKEALEKEIELRKLEEELIHERMQTEYFKGVNERLKDE